MTLVHIKFAPINDRQTTAPIHVGYPHMGIQAATDEVPSKTGSKHCGNIDERNTPAATDDMQCHVAFYEDHRKITVTT